jgi:lambda repressor-like predicted transcriptional regulator
VIVIHADPAEAIDHLRQDLRAAIKRRGLTFRQAAQQIGCQYATVHRTARNVGTPSAAHFIRIRAWIAAEARR